MRFCTIVARNYLAYARVLASSLQRATATSRCRCCCSTTSTTWSTTPREPFEILRPADLDIEPREFHHMATIYDVLELSTAMKPWLLERLLEADDEVCYLDPDIEVFASLARSRGARPAATRSSSRPHTTTPLPRDGLLPSEQTIRLAGVFNLGFIAVSRDAGAVSVVVVGAAATRVPHRVRAGSLRRSALGRLRSELLRAHGPPRPGLQRRVLEPLRTRGEAGRRRLRGQRPAAALLPLQRLRPAASVRAEQASRPATLRIRLEDQFEVALLCDRYAVATPRRPGTWKARDRVPVRIHRRTACRSTIARRKVYADALADRRRRAGSVDVAARCPTRSTPTADSFVSWLAAPGPGRLRHGHLAVRPRGSTTSARHRRPASTTCRRRATAELLDWVRMHGRAIAARAARATCRRRSGPSRPDARRISRRA